MATRPTYTDYATMLAQPDLDVVAIRLPPLAQGADYRRRPGRKARHLREAAVPALPISARSNKWFARRACICASVSKCATRPSSCAVKSFWIGPARTVALRRGGLLSRHRALVYAVSLVSESAGRRELAAAGRLPRHGHFAVLPGRRRGGGVQLRTRSANSSFDAYEFPSTTVTLLHYADGKVGKVASVLDCLQPYYFHAHLIGSEGRLLDDKLHSTRIEGMDRHQWSKLSYRLVDSGDVAIIPIKRSSTAFFQPRWRRPRDAVQRPARGGPHARSDLRRRCLLAAEAAGETGGNFGTMS